MTQTFRPVITGIVLMVPEARTITPAAHITVLAPFGGEGGPTAGELSGVEEFFAEEMPFDFDLTEVCTFPSGVHYLSPEPAGTFRRLTHGLHQRFPAYPPYDGEFELLVPHLTIPDDAVVGRLPIHAHVREAALLHHEDGVFTELARFPLGTSAA